MAQVVPVVAQVGVGRYLEPTPPEAPVTSTDSPWTTFVRVRRFSAVPQAHGNEASSTSVNALSTGDALLAGTVTNSANPPSRSSPT